ncbi:MAG TPA: glutamate-5-semialdehyde dehydrogenase, partial [Solirubrobacterales bacterium]|nr:glutamate-5-semialdehyde dehydrogenase [Solirubrobacterales bacterium]
MAVTARSVIESCEAAKDASLDLARASTAVKDAALDAAARLLEERLATILEANAADLADERAVGLSSALRDRLTLTDARVREMAAGVRQIAALPDPVGEELDRRTLSSGLDLRKVRVPLGVVAVVYEARPNVTVDCAALTIKSGNAIVLRGSSYAERSNGALAAVMRDALAEAGLPEDAVVLLAGGGREDLGIMATQDGLVDLLIPRGGEGLKAALKDVATVPVMYAAAGNCHVYVHDDAELGMARRIAYNAKVQRPGVCNAAETLLVHESVAEEFLPGALADLHGAGVELVGDEPARAAADGVAVGPAAEADWDTEYLDMKMVVGVVGSLEEAVEH